MELLAELKEKLKNCEEDEFSHLDQNISSILKDNNQTRKIIEKVNFDFFFDFFFFFFKIYLKKG